MSIARHDDAKTHSSGQGWGARGARGARRTRGFTLIETMLAITLLAMMIGMIYAALNIGMRAWDTGEARVESAANWRTTEHFLRRELGQIFPTRWRGVPQAYIALDGGAASLKYVTALNLDAARQNGGAAGLQWAELSLVEGGILQLNRQVFDGQAQNFDGLNNAASGASAFDANPPAIPPVRLMENVRAVEIAYFGADTDLNEPTWRSEWRDLVRLPMLMKLSIDTGREKLEMVVALKIGEEAGCLANGLTRVCGPRPR